MSVAASRWVQRYLHSVPAPWRGGPSCHARAVLLALAADASFPGNVAATPAATIGAVVGLHERNVRKVFVEIKALSVVPCVERRGRPARWHFLVPPMSTTPGHSDPGSLVHNPGRDPAEPRATVARRRETGSRVTSPGAVPRGAMAVAE
jgi:hypothetical protein